MAAESPLTMASPPYTVRDAAFEVLRRFGLTTMFSNPGSTEVGFLADLPAGIRFVLGLHEASAVGMATGQAIATGRPALVLLHTTAGYGNAVSALATARVNRAPLVVIVGQQDRRHLAAEPFLTGHLRGLAGDYPVWYDEPVRAEDVPGAIARAWHEARVGRGPAVVAVNMDDWHVPVERDGVLLAPAASVTGTRGDPGTAQAVAEFVTAASAPVLVVGAGLDSAEGWAAAVALAERLRCPVWQESFGARAGFPQHHPLFAGHLPSARSRLRAVLDGHDLVLAVGAPVLRQYGYESGDLFGSGTTAVVITDDADEALRSPAALAVIADPASVLQELSTLLPQSSSALPEAAPAPAPAPPAAGEPLQAAHVLAILGRDLPADAVVVEETPSSRPDLHALVPARAPLGFLSAAMGGLGFAMPAAIGVRMGAPDRPVVAVLGDGSSLYSIQALWSAAHYGVGVLFIVFANGRYAVMDRLAEQYGDGAPPWPAFEEVSVSALARGFGCEAVRVDGHEGAARALAEVLPTLATRTTPLLLEIAVTPGDTFEP